jgi:endonuclease/exonuclease/phosphatase family metal-dependent hydrolase
MGDLNAPGRLPSLACRWRPLARAKTFPADRPSFQIDHALAHGLDAATTHVEARRLPLSDHRVLLFDLPG